MSVKNEDSDGNMDRSYKGHKIHTNAHQDPDIGGWTWVATIGRKGAKNHRLYGTLRKHDSKEEADRDAMQAAMKWIDNGKASSRSNNY
jgi:hypothetical protein